MTPQRRIRDYTMTTKTMKTMKTAAKTTKTLTPAQRIAKRKASASRPPPMEGTIKKTTAATTSRLVNIAVNDDFREAVTKAIKDTQTGIASYAALAAKMNTRFNFDWRQYAILTAKDAATYGDGKRVNVDRATFYAVNKELGGTNPRPAWMLLVRYAEEIAAGTRNAATGAKIKVKGSARPGSNARSDLVRATDDLRALWTWTGKKGKELDPKVKAARASVSAALLSLGIDPKTIKLT